jgi:hypothetical protein
VYIGSLLFTLLIFLIVVKLPLLIIKRKHIVKKELLLFNVFLFFVVLICTAVSIIFLSSDVGGYLSLFSSDSLRYIKEINLFSTDLSSINELNGSFYEYEVTPKMGMSSLIAWIVVLFEETTGVVYYILNNMTVLFMLFFANSLLHQIAKIFSVQAYSYLALAVFVFLFPVDFYWLLRFLREGGANTQFISLLLLPILMLLKPKKRYVYYYSFFSLLLLFYRPQLLVMSAAFFIILNIFSVKCIGTLILTFLLGTLATLQCFDTMGFYKFLTVLDKVGLDFTYPLLNYIVETNKNKLIIVICAWSCIAPFLIRKSSVVNISKVNKILFYTSFSFSMLSLIIVSVLSYGKITMQVRFFYPLLYFLKILFLAYILNNRAKKLKNINVSVVM